LASELPFHGIAGYWTLDEEELSAGQAWSRLAQCRAVCFGEIHDNAFHHNAQLRALQFLAEQSRGAERRLAIGYEMFQTPFQAPLSLYVGGALGEAGMLEQTEYFERWSSDFTLYRALLEATRDAHLPALALNAPQELTR
jgi:uncharacterized iron-regulated protein